MLEMLVVIILQDMSVTLSVERAYGIKTMQECTRILPKVVKPWKEVKAAYCFKGDITVPVEKT